MWIPSALRWQVWRRDNFTYLTCGRREDLTIDHIIPESKGGMTEFSNLQTLCKPCNSSKGTQRYSSIYPNAGKQQGGQIRLQDDCKGLTVPEAAKCLGKPKMTLYRWIDANKILWLKFGGILFIPVSEVERLNKK